MKKFWNWKNHQTMEGEEPERDLDINGTIAEESWFDDEITPEMFRQELFSSRGRINLWINSPGGDCIAASRIYSMLMDYPDEVIVIIDGIAASAASVIAMAGTKVLMAPTALMMIHNPATSAFGDYRDMNKAIDLLNEVKESIINAYQLKTGMSRTVISHLMDAETWMNANKAIEMKFVDGLLEDEKKTVIQPAYAFSSREFASKLLNKIATKNQVDSTATQKEGRKVRELKNTIDTLKKVI
ncbi:MAG: Clp protease ClpP [Bacilli bacterium]|nr:Clp protease ClpP [Bacilli bacterium]